MSWRGTKSPGWAAVDLKRKEKQGTELEAQNEPYPPISNNIAPLPPCQNVAKDDDFSVRSFSSVLAPVNFPIIMTNKDIDDPLQAGNSSTNHSGKFIDRNKKNNVLQSYKKLKEVYSWADKNLIEDIVAAVKNDVEKASDLLKGMSFTGILEENKETNFEDLEYKTKEKLLGDNLLQEDIGLFSENWRSIPIEPDWEEDDIYSIHRKDAIRVMRSASRHSKAANDAYLRGDHLSAQEFSIKAHKEWSTAEKLNAKAAKEILSIRNSHTDEWKLDLHGLHAAEAVQALAEHLQKIECQVPVHCSVYPNSDNTKVGFSHAASVESSSHMEMEKSNKKQQSSRQRPMSVEVITGRGNHSRGEAALPTAIRNFLDEKGYHYYEARTGVITVQPKFRRL